MNWLWYGLMGCQDRISDLRIDDYIWSLIVGIKARLSLTIINK